MLPRYEFRALSEDAKTCTASGGQADRQASGSTQRPNRIDQRHRREDDNPRSQKILHTMSKYWYRRHLYETYKGKVGE